MLRKYINFRFLMVASIFFLLGMKGCSLLDSSKSFPTKISKGNNKDFDTWASLAQGKWISPMWEQSKKQDLKIEWIGADGKNIKLVVQQPINMDNRKKINIAAIKPEEDARIYFEKAIIEAKKQNANTISLSHVDYNFRSTEKTVGSHLLLENLKDFILEGNGARLNFSQNLPGILIKQSQRIRIENLNLSYSLLSTSLGQIKNIEGEKHLVIDPKFPVTEKDKIYQISEIDPVKLEFIPGGARMIWPPEKELSAIVENNSYKSKAFNKLKDNSKYLVIHQWYGGSAIKIDGTRNNNQTEDISIVGVNVNSTPGMGVAVTGLKRGFALTDSSFSPDPNSGNIGGPAWDGLHIASGGGDILISRNRFSVLGDDGINLNNPVHPIIAIDTKTNKLTLAKSARFIAKNDTLAFFSELGGYLGKAMVTSDTVDKGRGNYEVTLDVIPKEVSERSLVRDVDQICSRFSVTDNIFEDMNGHGVLAQIPNGQISNNKFLRLNRNAIRMLSSIGTWNEGVGAFNIAVRNNEVINGGIDLGMDIPWSAITVYGQRRGGNLSEHLYNENIEITGNRLQGLRQGCFGIANSRNVLIKNNFCETSETKTLTKNIKIVKSLAVTNE
jgi:hypothetical protein